MENNVLAINFRPPAPYSMDGYFDLVTDNLVTNSVLEQLRNAYQLPINRIREKIDRKPPTERAALLGVLEHRLSSYWEARQIVQQAAKADPDALTTYIMKDVLGIKGGTVDEKARSKFKSLLMEEVKSGLNKTGKDGLKFSQRIYAIVVADSDEARKNAVISAFSGMAKDWVKDNYTSLIRSGLQRMGANSAVRNRLLKVIALRIAWYETLAARLAWVSPVVFAIDLLLTPESIASDADEERLAFFGMYTQVCEDRRIILSTIIERATDNHWKYRIEPAAALGATIRAR